MLVAEITERKLSPTKVDQLIYPTRDGVSIKENDTMSGHIGTSRVLMHKREMKAKRKCKQFIHSNGIKDAKKSIDKANVIQHRKTTANYRHTESLTLFLLNKTRPHTLRLAQIKNPERNKRKTFPCAGPGRAAGLGAILAATRLKPAALPGSAQRKVFLFLFFRGFLFVRV